MKVINIHKRTIQQPVSKIADLMDTLATRNDMVLATDKWPPMRLDQGLQVGSKGGHGPIKYFVTDYQSRRSITFQFDMPGLNGHHKFEITQMDIVKTELSHRIDMTTTGTATIKWALVIRWLHDAYIEDAFDKVENHFSENKKRSAWNLWVKIWRRILKPRKKRYEPCSSILYKKSANDT